MEKPIARLTRDNCVLLLVDIQTRLLPEMWEAQRLERNCAMLCQVARRFEIPIIVTEQNPVRLGHTVDAIQEAIGEFEPIAKMTFSGWPGIQEPLAATGRKTILICGGESHICVTQTALDLLENGYTVFGAYDAISSRQSWNRQIGWERIKGAGAIASSTESAIYEWLGEAGTDDFRAILPLVK